MSMIKMPDNSFHQLLKQIVRELLKMSTLRFAVLLMIVAELLSIVIVLSIDFLWDGRFNKELAFAGAVTPVFVGLFVVVFVTAMFDEIREEMARRKLKEIELRESESEFHTLAEAMPQIVWITRADGWNIYFNQQWMDYTGLTLEESLGHGWNKPFHPVDQQRTQDAWQHAVTEGGIYSIESRLRRADGIYRWWLVRGVPVKDANGDILKWFGTCTDIHDLKMAELAISNANAELSESERRFSDLLGNVELISMMLDREARITYCNEYLLRLTGWKREEIIGKNWFDIFSPPERKYLNDAFFAALLANQPEAHHHENEILTRSGGLLLVHWNNSVLRSAEGDVIGTASIGEDITARKRAKEEIEFKNTILQTQQEASPDAILVVDENGNIISFNQQFIELWHLTPQMVSARLDAPMLQLVVEQVENPEAFVARIQYLYEHRDEKSNEEIRLKDGRVLDRYSAPVSGANGKYYGRVWYFRNITARKTLEQDREQYLKFFMLSINPMCIADPYGCFAQVNPAFVKLTGYSESELVAKPFLDFVMPGDRQRTEDEMQLQVEKRPTLYFDNHYLCKDGSVIDLSWTAYYDKHDGITYATAIDITERKRTEESLRKLSLAVEQSPSAIDITDLDANIEYVNEAFVRTSGYSVAELIGQNPRLLQSGKTPKASYVDMWAHLLRGEMWKGEFINRRKDGSEYIESALVSPVRQTDGRVTHYLAVKEDITQLKQAQKTAHESGESLNRMLNSMAEGAYGVDTNGDCTFVNHAFLKMLGYQNDSEVMGKHIHELVHHSRIDGSLYPGNECKAYRAYRTNQSINVSDEVFWRKDGVSVPVEYWSHPIESDGVTIGAIVTFIDITERKRVEETLKNMAAKFHTLFETSSDAIMLLDEKGFFDCNEATLRLFGCTTRDEFISRHPADYSPSRQPGGEDSLSLANEHIATAFKLGSNLFEWTHRRQDGSEFPADVLLNALVLDGKSVLQATVRDITERKRAEAVMREKDVLLSESQRIAHIGSWHFDLSKNLLTWSDETYRIYGVSPDTFTPNAESFLNLIHPADRQALQEQFSSCLAGNKPGELTFRTIHPNGTERVLSGFGELQYDALNRPSHLMGVAYDITERRLSEEKLRSTAEKLHESQQLMEAIVENIPIMVFVKRASDLRFELFNHAGEKLLGYSRDDLLGKGNYDLWPKEQGDWFDAADRKVLASKEVTEILEEPINTASGETRYLHTWKIALRDNDGNPTHLLGLSIDITERKLTEATLTEQLEELRRWHDVTSGRETRILDLKHEVNELLEQTGKQPRYPSAVLKNSTEK